jgi:protein-tyrosine kinase
MERIQSAIKKARANRQGGGAPPPATATAPRALHTAGRNADSIAAAWHEIAMFKPSLRALKDNRVFTVKAGDDAAPFDMMRARVFQQMRSNDWRRLAVVSPGEACGKTTLSANLAFSLARQPDLNLALIELDMHRPSLARTLGLPAGDEQFSRTLEDRSPAFQHMLRYGHNLAFAFNRSAAPNTEELLQTSHAAEVFSDLERALDLSLMIFDMPPMLSNGEMMGFADQVDCVLLVAAAERTTLDEIDMCERNLSEVTNLLGVVLNKCRYADLAGGYG